MTNEAFARVKIDALLAAQGWDTLDTRAVRFEVQLPDGTRADYVLCDRHGRSLAVIEAKRYSVSPNDAAAQAKAYAQQLGVPYAFLCNGDEVLFWEWQREAYPRQVKTIFKQDDLERRIATLSVRRDPASVDIDRRIVDLLARAEGIVRLRRDAQKKAAELIPAIFIDMFGDPATNPKQWPVRTLGEVLDAIDYGSSTKASPTGAGLPIIRMGNVTTAGDLDLDDLKFVELSENEAERFRLRKGDLLFNRTNSKELVGKTGLWDGSLDAVVASYFIRLRAQPDVAVPSYLWAWMNSRRMKQVLFDTARGAIGQANINSRELRAFQVAVPPLKQQQAFDAWVHHIRSICRQQAEALIRATATFDALLSRAFN